MRTWLLVILLFTAWLPLAKTATADTLPLSQILTLLSQRHQQAIVFIQADILGKRAPLPSKTLSLQTSLAQLLPPFDLQYIQTEVGIVIRPNKQSDIAVSAAEKALDEVVVVGVPMAMSAASFEDDYASAAQRARQLKLRQNGESDYLLGSMLKGLPAENLAESMQVLPGVVISRDRGEGLNITALGLGAEYQLTLLNGRRIANTENVRNSNQYGQEYRFDTLSAGVFSAVEVHKTASSTLPTGAVGATINIVSDEPLEYKQAHLQIKMLGSRLSTDNQVAPNLALAANWLNDSQTFAWVTKLNYQSRLQRQFQYETWHWGQNDAVPSQFYYANLPNDVLVPSDGIALTIENENRARLTHFIAAQWQVNSQQSWQFNWFKSSTDFQFDEQRLGLHPGSRDSTSLAYSDEYALNQVTYQHADVTLAREFSELNYQNDTRQLSAKIETHWGGNKFRFLPFLSWSQALSDTTSPIARLRSKVADVDVDFAVSHNTLLRFELNNAPLNANQLSAISGLSERNINVDNLSRELGIDWQWLNNQPLSGFGFSTLKGGWLISTQQHRYFRQDIALNSQELAAIDASNPDFYELIPMPFAAEFAKNVTPQWLLPNRYLLEQFQSSLVFAELSDNDHLNSYQVNFDSQEAYFSADWHSAEWPNFQLQTGLRFDHTQSRSFGYGLVDDTIAARKSRISYTHWLPDMSLMWQIAEQWQWRSSVSRSISLPNYSDLNPKIHAHSGGLPYADGGNPELRPVVSLNLSTSLTYLMPQSQFSLLWFEKALSNFISERVSQIVFQGIDYSLQTKTNEGRASVSGLEASLTFEQQIQAGFFESLSLSATATHLSHAGEYQVQGQTHVAPLEGVSGVSANVRLVFKKQAWQTAINFNYRSDYLEQLDDSNRANVWVDAYTSLDTSLTYTPVDWLIFRLDIYNFLNENKRRYAKEGKARALMKVEDFGTRAAVSLQMNW